MARRLLRVSVLTMLTLSLLLGGGSAATDAVHADPHASGVAPLESGLNQASEQFELRSAIAFASTRANSTGEGIPGLTLRERLLNSADIYLMLMNDDGTPVQDSPEQNPRRLTDITSSKSENVYDAFPGLSPDGKKIVFDSNRLGAHNPPTVTCPGPPACTTTDNVDLFVMDADGSNQRHLTRCASSTISPNGKNVACHASFSRNYGPFKTAPSAATADSDIFVLNVDDCLKVMELYSVDDCREISGEHLKNITTSPDVDDDPDWSPVLPDGTQKIVFTRHPVSENVPDSVYAPHAEIFVMTVNPNGTPVQDPQPLTNNLIEERAPAWSPDGARIAFMCRQGQPPTSGGVPTNEICVMSADGTNKVQLTDDNVLDATPSWSPDGRWIVFAHGPTPAAQLWLVPMNQDGTCVKKPDGKCDLKQLTNSTGSNASPNWGQLRVHVRAPAVTQPSTSAPASAPVPQPRGR